MRYRRNMGGNPILGIYIGKSLGKGSLNEYKRNKITWKIHKRGGSKPIAIGKANIFAAQSNNETVLSLFKK